jgi:hypothetical protein
MFERAQERRQHRCGLCVMGDRVPLIHLASRPLPGRERIAPQQKSEARSQSRFERAVPQCIGLPGQASAPHAPPPR